MLSAQKIIKFNSLNNTVGVKMYRVEGKEEDMLKTSCPFLETYLNELNILKKSLLI